MNFPKSVSFTLTNVCNLRCKMCGQWSQEGYMHDKKNNLQHELELSDWKRLIDELAANNVNSVLLRGGEPFLFPGIMGLLNYINSKGIFTSIDTNGTMLKNYAEEIVRLGNIHLTFSVDGPEEIHDYVRGIEGSFKRTAENIMFLNELEKKYNTKISKSITFTISAFSYKGLGQMPDIARSLGVDTITIVPYYYVPDNIGKLYESELREKLSCSAYTWQGFHHEDSGIDFDVFKKEYRTYLSKLEGINDFPYMKLSEEEYRKWFEDSLTPVGKTSCTNVEKLIDIQPNGDANFCVDFPDYIIGNVKNSTIKELWNSERAEKFRECRRNNPFSLCYRCGAKYMSEIEG